jgi:hypothetical protein
LVLIIMIMLVTLIILMKDINIHRYASSCLFSSKDSLWFHITNKCHHAIDISG